MEQTQLVARVKRLQDDAAELMQIIQQQNTGQSTAPPASASRPASSRTSQPRDTSDDDDDDNDLTVVQVSIPLLTIRTQSTLYLHAYDIRKTPSSDRAQQQRPARRTQPSTPVFQETVTESAERDTVAVG